MSLLSPLGVAFIYGALYGTWAGISAGLVSGFSLFVVKVATGPHTLETEVQKVEREKLNRDVAALVLITAVFGCAISSLLQ